MLRRCIQEIKENNVPGSMAELGVYQGDFAKYLNRGLPIGSSIYLIRFPDSMAETKAKRITSWDTALSGFRTRLSKQSWIRWSKKNAVSSEKGISQRQ